MKTIATLLMFCSVLLAQTTQVIPTNLGKGINNNENSNVLVCSCELNYYNPDGYGPYWALLKVHGGYYPGQGGNPNNYEIRVYANPICATTVVNWFYIGKIDSVSGVSLSGDIECYATSNYGELELSLVGYIIHCEVWEKTTNTKVNETTFLKGSNESP